MILHICYTVVVCPKFEEKKSLLDIWLPKFSEIIHYIQHNIWPHAATPALCIDITMVGQIQTS